MNQIFLESFLEVNKKHFNNEYTLVLERFVTFFNVSENSIQSKEDLGKIISSYYQFMIIFKEVIKYNAYYKVYGYGKSQYIDSKEILFNYEFTSEININILSMFILIKKEDFNDPSSFSKLEYTNYIRKLTEQKLSRNFIEEAFNSLLVFLKKWEEDLGFNSLTFYGNLIENKKGILYHSDTAKDILSKFLSADSYCYNISWSVSLYKNNLVDFLANLIDKESNFIVKELSEEPCFEPIFSKNYRAHNMGSIHELLTRFLKNDFLEAFLSPDPIECFRNNLLIKIPSTTVNEDLFCYLKKDLAAIEKGINGQNSFKLLLHGIAGTGKTELSKVISHISNKSLYKLKIVDTLDDNSTDLMTFEHRVSKFLSTLSSISAIFKNNDFILLIDECEEVFENKNQQKEMITRILDNLNISCIFIANNIKDFHSAYLRRFTYHLNVDICDYSQKLNIINNYLLKNEEYSYLYDDKIIDYIATQSVTNADIIDNIDYYNTTKNFDFLFQKISNQKITQEIVQLNNIEQSMYNFIYPENNKYDFNKIIGYKQEKELLLGLEHYLLNKKEYNDLKVNMPHGTILYGNPGTGKTSIIKALSKRCNLPLLVVSTGMMNNDSNGALHIKKIFNLAKKNSPCLILLDEFEKMALNRKLEIKNGTSQSLMNQLLIELDEIQKNNLDIFTYATCNTIDYIDPAISRSGRLEQMIEIGLPPSKIREEMLKTLLGEKNKVNGIKQIVQHTTGLSFIDLDSIVNSYKISLLKNKENKSKQSLLFKSIHDFSLGKIKTVTLLKDEKKLVAYHESGHALIAYLFGRNVGNVSIIPKSGSLGTTLMLKDENKNLKTKEDLEHELMILMAGRAAENVFLHTETNGSSNDFYRATNLVMSNLYILSHETIGLIYPNMAEYSQIFSQDYKLKVELSVNEILHVLYEKTKNILMNSKEEIESMVNLLMKKEEIIQPEMENILFQTMKIKNSTKLSLIG